MTKQSLQHHFSEKSSILVDFGVPFWVQNGLQNGCKKQQMGFLASWGPQSAPRGHFWSILGAIWGPLGAIWGPLGAILAQVGTILGLKQHKESADCRQAARTATNSNKQQLAAANSSRHQDIFVKSSHKQQVTKAANGNKQQQTAAKAENSSR